MINLGTKPIKNKDSKKNGLVIDQSAKDICFNCSMNFEIMTAVCAHAILSKPLDINLKHVLFPE